MSVYGLLMEGHVVRSGDVLDDAEGKTKYTVIDINPDNITIEWDSIYTGGIKQATIPPSSWGDVTVVNLKGLDDPNLMFKLRRK